MGYDITYSFAEINAASHLVHYYNKPGGYSGGSYAEKLIALMDAADKNELKKLLFVYPEYELGVKILNENGADALSDFVVSVRREGRVA